MKNKKLGLGLLVGAMFATPAAFAGYDIALDNNASLSFGGYFKADLRSVSGDIAYRDFWVGNNSFAPDTKETRLNIRESRFNIGYKQGDFKGVLEWDFYDDQQPTGTTETVTGGHSLRLRHAFVQYKNWKVGQTWSTFMPLASIPEALDFGGAHGAQSFVRQTQIRYTDGGLELAIENGSTQSGESQYIPDVVARYTVKQDWGQISVAALVRSLEDSNNDGGADGTQVAYNVHGKIKTVGKDDLRFSYNGGAGGRYISPGANIADLADANGDIHKIDAYTVAYRHFWNKDYRSTLYYGAMKIDALGADRKHIGLNLLKSVTKKLTIGGEIGNYKTESGDSNYLQISAKYVL